MTPTTRKTLEFSYVNQDEKVHVAVQGGVINIVAEEPGIIVNGEGPLFVPLSQLRTWVSVCEARAHDQGTEEAPDGRSREGLPEEAADRLHNGGEAP